MRYLTRAETMEAYYLLKHTSYMGGWSCMVYAEAVGIRPTTIPDETLWVHVSRVLEGDASTYPVQARTYSGIPVQLKLGEVICSKADDNFYERLMQHGRTAVHAVDEAEDST